MVFQLECCCSLYEGPAAFLCVYKQFIHKLTLACLLTLL